MKHRSSQFRKETVWNEEIKSAFESNNDRLIEEKDILKIETSHLKILSRRQSYTSSDRKKVHLGFFSWRVIQFWEMVLVFHYYLGKFGFNIFLDLKSKKIKWKKYLKN